MNKTIANATFNCNINRICFVNYLVNFVPEAASCQGSAVVQNLIAINHLITMVGWYIV